MNQQTRCRAPRSLARRARSAFLACCRNLIKVALPRFLVEAPTQKSCAVTKPSAGEMIILNFGHEFCFHRLPFARFLIAPTARTTGRVAGKAGRFDQGLEYFR